MKYLVTGGLGFVGNEVVRQLLENKQEVIVIDNATGIAPHIDDILQQITVYKKDITDSDAVDAIITHEQPDHILHLAAMHYIPLCNQQPLQTHQVNVTGTMHILESAAKNQTAHCTLISSGAIYADSDEALNEATSPCAIFDVYSYSKKAVEDLGNLYAQRNPGIQFNIVRLFNVYGARETNPHIIPEIISQLRKGDVLNLGNIAPKRDFIHVQDAAAGILAIASRKKGAPIETINLCSGMDIAMADIIKIISQELNRTIHVEINPEKYRVHDKQFQKGSTEKLYALTGFNCRYDITKGIRLLLQTEQLL